MQYRTDWRDFTVRYLAARCYTPEKLPRGRGEH